MVSARQGKPLAPKCRVTTATTFRVARKRGSLLCSVSSPTTARIEAIPSNAAAPFRLPHLRFTIDNRGVTNSTLHTTQET